MTDRELMQQALEAKQTSLIELLEAVPVDARLVVDDGPHSTSFYPVGRMCHGAAAALRERLAQPEQEPVAWQRIETAPKTGRKVILFYLNRNNIPRTVMARWLSDDEAAETDTDCVGLEGGWYECIDNWDDYTEVAIHEGEPTYWMPLPPPPIEAKLKEKNT